MIKPNITKIVCPFANCDGQATLAWVLNQEDDAVEDEWTFYTFHCSDMYHGPNVMTKINDGGSLLYSAVIQAVKDHD